MKKRFFALFICIIFSIISFTTNVLAYGECVDYKNTFGWNNSKTIRVITEDEWKQYLSEDKYNINTYNWCCGMAQLAYRYKRTEHIYPNGGGFCLALIAVGDEYCVNCSIVWRRDIIIDQTNYGCGVYHK